jgi:hypothetical protein
LSGGIDLLSERIWPITEFATAFSLPDGKTFTENDLRRWVSTGSREIRLDSINFRRAEGVPMETWTSKEALARFVDAHQGLPIQFAAATRRAAPDGGGRAAGVGGVQ